MDAKRNLYQAIDRLLQVQSIDQVSIDMILEESDVSRATFYRHFKDKYDLMHWFYGSYVKKAVFHPESTWEEIILNTANFTFDNREYLRNAIKYEGQNSFPNFIQNFSRDFCISRYKSIYKVDELPTYILFAIEYHCAGAVQIFSSWLKSDMSIPPEELSKMFYQCVPATLKEVLA